MTFGRLILHSIRKFACTVIFITFPAVMSYAGDLFVHPGLLNNSASLHALSQLASTQSNSQAADRFRILINGDPDIGVKADSRFSLSYTPEPLEFVSVIAGSATEEERRFRNDTRAAYYLAIRWVVSGDVRYRDKAIEIVNAWSSVFRGLKNAPGTWSDTYKVEAAWAIPMWTNAAEIILYYQPENGPPKGYTPWSDADIGRFRGFIARLHAHLGDISSSDRNSNLRMKENNQAASAALSDMSVGVFNDDQELYEHGLSRMKQLLPKLISKSGEVKELRTRDCTHPQFNLAALIQAAQIEISQGSAGAQDPQSLAGFRYASSQEPALLRGVEYMSYSLNVGPPASRDCSDKKLRDGFGALAIEMYGLDSVPQLRAAIKKGVVRSGNFIDLTDVTHGVEAP